MSKNKTNNTHPIVWTIIGGSLLSLIEFVLNKFLNINFHLYISHLLLAIIGMIIFLVYYLDKTKKELEKSIENSNSSKKEFKNIVKRLSDKLTLVTWTSNKEEHDTNVFQKMHELLNNPLITGMDVLSIFQYGNNPKGKSKKAVKKYYNAIEEAIKGRAFRYRRAVITREKLQKEETEHNITTLLNNRFEFIEHWNRIHNDFNKSTAEIKAFHDEGRIIDIAFAIFYQGNVHGKDICNLVIEISVWSLEKKNQIMGLLNINSPGVELINAFHGAFTGLFDKKLEVKEYSFDEIWPHHKAYEKIERNSK